MATIVTPVAGMIAGCLASWLVVARLSGGAAGPELPYGMLGPLVAVVGTWIAVVRAHAADPASVTGVMIRAFVLKLVFFGLYVTVMMTTLGLDPRRFVISFAAYFLMLYLVEAMLLQRLFTRRLGDTR
jgi:hypothetical protein